MDFFESAAKLRTSMFDHTNSTVHTHTHTSLVLANYLITTRGAIWRLQIKSSMRPHVSGFDTASCYNVAHTLSGSILHSFLFYWID